MGKSNGSTLVILFLTIALLLGVGVGGFTMFQYYAINVEPDQFDEKEFQRYKQTMATEEPVQFESQDQITADTVDEGMYIRFKGVVQEVKTNFILFTNGIKCYFIDGAMNMEARDKVLAMMNEIEKGSTVELEGMVSQITEEDISIKYCDVPEGVENNGIVNDGANPNSQEGDTGANTLSISASDIKSLKGSWYDTWSQRAVMKIEYVKEDIFRIKTSWGSSAMETTFWEMTASYDPDSKTLTYDDCKCYNQITDEKGNETKETVYTKGKGKFKMDENGYLSWESVNDDSVNKCKFEHFVDL